MSVQLLFYNEVVPVSSERHHDLSIKAGSDFNFAAAANAVPVVAAEFGRASAEYPIVFAGEGDNEMPVAILGAAPGQNLFVGRDGRWTGNYVPAFVRRYPFVFASGAENRERLALCVDETFAGCNRDGRGERLFDAAGERTQFLGSVIGFMQDYQGQYERTRAFAGQLRELDLLVPMQAQYNANDGSRRSLAGFRVVDRGRLKALDADRLTRLVRDDSMEWIFAHLSSLQHLASITQRAASQHPEADPDPAAHRH